jgi:formyl-CoA transferase
LINIAANKDEQWQLLARHIGRDDLVDRPEYATREDRKRNRLALKDDLESVLKTRPAREWAKELNQIGVPSGAVLSVEEVLKMPQIATRGLLETFTDVPGVGRGISVISSGVKLDGAAPHVATPPPQLGQDTDAVLSDLGLSPDQITELRDEGVI